MRQNGNLVAATRAGGGGPISQQQFAHRKKGLVAGPENLVAEAIRKIDLLWLFDLNDAGAIVIKSRKVPGHNGVMRSGLLEFLGGSDAARNNGIGINHTIMAGRDLRPTRKLNAVGGG